ncbi:hypothetical protein E4U31_000501 [Claviceps sp. LM219 group G6]|nr:hypothetical protein E4U31_000501 [Claviceps sp. LM219 group G6]
MGETTSGARQYSSDTPSVFLSSNAALATSDGVRHVPQLRSDHSALVYWCLASSSDMNKVVSITALQEMNCVIVQVALQDPGLVGHTAVADLIDHLYAFTADYPHVS